MRKLAAALIALVLLATIGVGAAMAADKQVPPKDRANVQADGLTGISGNVGEARAALAEPSAIRYKILVVTDSLPEDRTAYLDRVLAQWGWPDADQLLLVLFAEGNYDIRFAMGSDFGQQGVRVDEMLGYVRNVYLPELRKGDPGTALAAFVRAVNRRMMPRDGLTPEQLVKGFYDRHAGYHSPTDRSLSGNRLVDKSYRSSGYLAPEYVAALDELLSGEFPADPILCAQAIPEKITLGKAKIIGDEASVIVNTHWANGMRDLSVLLRKLDGAWKITKVTCPK
ncbi:MAG TPA: hypothetical protein VD969_28055 [Symbiobacteriaceae bacterium]|nr:hypothetical protein [Symbiobacteriaceae bacterium]